MLQHAQGWDYPNIRITSGGTTIIRVDTGAQVQTSDASAEASAIIFTATSTTVQFTGNLYDTSSDYGGGWNLVEIAE